MEKMTNLLQYLKERGESLGVLFTRKTRKIEYTIVFCGGQCTLAKEVQKIIDEGWSPQGGVSHTVTETGGCKVVECWAQAMIRRV